MPPIWSVPDHDKPVVVRLEVPALRRKTLRIMGGMRNTLVPAGTLDEVRETTREVCQRVG